MSTRSYRVASAIRSSIPQAARFARRREKAKYASQFLMQAACHLASGLQGESPEEPCSGTLRVSENASDSNCYKEIWPLIERPGFLARRLHQIHVSLFAELCATFRMTPLQYSLLSALAVLDEADQTTLARAVALDRTTTTGALKRLESRGLLQRVTSAQDRRAQVCRMTPEGASLLSAMEASARAAHEATVEALDADERATFLELLKRVVTAHDGRRAENLRES
ncbi:MarR family winged helix-turn-helix transcriptional regulator [Methylopila henanensis]|uniref:MarR family winged helix-turn-helix transcriptional regulator n=1 Tax=Methylopila henanensis TaxID=873516 RepID=A0ABW4KBB5_9HYPH